jgi:hypothetical protein
MSDIQDYMELKQGVERSRREMDKAIGAVEQLQARLEKEFGCKTLEEAEILLKEKNKEKEKAHKAFNKAFQKLEEQMDDTM